MSWTGEAALTGGAFTAEGANIPFAQVANFVQLSPAWVQMAAGSSGWQSPAAAANSWTEE